MSSDLNIRGIKSPTPETPFDEISVEQIISFMNASLHNVILVDGKCNIQAINNKMCQILGAPANEFLCKPFNSVWKNGVCQKEINRLVKQGLRGISGTFEGWLELMTEERLFFKVDAAPVKIINGKPCYVLLTMVNYTAAKEVEIRLNNVNQLIGSLAMHNRDSKDQLLSFLSEQWNAEYVSFRHSGFTVAGGNDRIEAGTVSQSIVKVIVALEDQIDQESNTSVFSKYEINGKKLFLKKIKSGGHFFGVLSIVFNIGTSLTQQDEWLLGIISSVFGALIQREAMQLSILKSRQQLEFLFESIPMHVALIDRELKIYYINEFSSREMGYASEDIFGSSFLQFYPATTHSTTRGQVRAGFDHPATWFIWENEREAKSGLKLWMRETARYFRDSEGLELLLIISEDVTNIRQNNERIRQLNLELEQRVLERTEALRRSEEKFRSLFESMHDVFFIIEHDGTISEISPAVELYSNKTRKEIIGTSIRAGYFQEDEDIDRIAKEIFEKGEIVDYEMCFNGLNNFHLFVSCNARVIRGSDGQVLRIEGSFRDITDRKAAENALLKKVKIEELLANISTRFINLGLEETEKTIISTLRLIAHFTDSDVVHIILKESGTKLPQIMSWSRKTSFRRGSRFHNNSADIVLPNMLTLKMFSPVFVRKSADINYSKNELYSFLKAQGICSALLFPIGYRNSNIGYIGYFSTDDIPGWMGGDVSFLNILAEVYSNLFERIKIEEEFIAAKMLAEESNRIKEQFLAHMSHEFRTPLNAIVGSAQIIKESRSQQKGRKYLETIITSADSLLGLVNDVLDFSRIQTQKLSLDPFNFSLRSMLNRVMQMAREQSERKKLKLEMTVSAEVPDIVYGDSHRLMQILMNLITNAVKFTDEGGIWVSVQAIPHTKQKISVSISVKDTGIGIPKNMLSKIFQDFVQLNDIKHRGRGGAGLGLAICKNLVTLMGGTISVESKINKGSKFLVTVPLSVAKEYYITDHTGKRMSAPDVLRGRKALVIEDNKFNQQIVGHYLKNWKVRYDFAENAEAALRLLNSKVFDLIILDIGLPDMNGYELTRYIRKKLKPPSSLLPIIALTAAATDEEKIKAIKAGMNDFLPKPFTEHILHTKMCEVLLNTQYPGSGVQSGKQKSVDLPGTAYFIPEKIMEKRYLTVPFLLDIIRAFCENAPQLIYELSRQVAVSNYTEIRRLAHKAKSMYGFLRLNEAVKLFGSIENNSEKPGGILRIQQDFQKIEPMTMAIIKEMSIIVKKVKKEI